ncbi:transposase, partial [Streptomyces sp. CB01580]|uniref:transposase n=1 Tax=Streptomyces sp. CB01580 TaxID=1703933 RepID=UPI003FD1AA50
MGDTGCKWRALPTDFPPWRMVWGLMARWAAAGVIGHIRDHLSGQSRHEMGKGPRTVATVARVWALPNPSGLNAHWTTPTMAEEYGRLRA